MNALLPALLSTAAVLAPTPGHDDDPIPAVIVTLENAQPSRGVFLTPPWIGIHDGSFDTYDGGSPASVPLGGNEIEALAEDGNNGPITATFDALLPGAPQRMGVPGPGGPLAPGDRASVTLLVDPTRDRYFSYASMIIPSNDAFIANGDPLAHELFDAHGRFVARGFLVSGAESNDAGTEVNDELAPNVAFLGQAGPNTGVSEDGVVVTPSPGFAAPGVLGYPDGVLNHPVFGNGRFNTAGDRLLRVSFRYVDLGQRLRLRSELDAAQEVQGELVDSDGRGWAWMRARDGRELRLVARFRDLTGPLAAAHLHLGQAGTNGPVVVDLGDGIEDERIRFTVRAGDLTGPLAGQDFTALLGELAAGNVYLNLHTAAFPAGEIRGQVQLRD